MRYVCLLLIAISQVAFTQQPTSTYGDFVALLENGERIEGTKCFLSPTELSGVTTAGVRISLPLPSVKTLYVSAGSKSGQYALLGAGFGLGVGACMILLAEGRGKVNYGAIGGLTAAAIVVGAVLGATEQSWDTVDLTPFRRASKVDSSQSRPLR